MKIEINKNDDLMELSSSLQVFYKKEPKLFIESISRDIEDGYYYNLTDVFSILPFLRKRDKVKVEILWNSHKYNI